MVNLLCMHLDEASGHALLRCDGFDVAISQGHLAKLRELYRRNGGDKAGFLAAAYAVVARYHSLQGGNPRNGGMQAALHPQVFDVLAADFGCTAECFASPLNCRYER